MLGLSVEADGMGKVVVFIWPNLWLTNRRQIFAERLIKKQAPLAGLCTVIAEGYGLQARGRYLASMVVPLPVMLSTVVLPQAQMAPPLLVV